MNWMISYPQHNTRIQQKKYDLQLQTLRHLTKSDDNNKHYIKTQQMNLGWKCTVPRLKAILSAVMLTYNHSVPWITHNLFFMSLCCQDA